MELLIFQYFLPDSVFELNNLFDPMQIGVLNILWNVSGVIAGLISTILLLTMAQKNDSLRWLDYFPKILNVVAIASYFILAVLVDYENTNFGLYVVVVMLSGAASLAQFGLVFMALIEALHPISGLLIGNLINLTASTYSSIILGLKEIRGFNVFFIMGFVAIPPWIYILISFKANLTRYRYQLNAINDKFELIELENEADYKID